MPRVISDDRLDGAKSVDHAYEPPAAPLKPASENDAALKYVTSLIERLPGMIASATKAPVVHVESQKPPDIKVTSPVYVTPPEIKIPQAPAVQIPQGKAPVVNVEPPTVQLTINRPKEWKFTVHRNDYGQITTIDAKAV